MLLHTGDRGIALPVTGYRVVLSLLILAASACTEAYSPEELAEAPAINWEKPDHVVEVPDLDGAGKLLSFTPIKPKLSRLNRIYVSDPGDTFIESRGIVFLFEEPSDDPYWVIESPSEVTEQGFKKDLRSDVAQCAGANRCVGSWSMVAVRGDRDALLIQNGSRTTVILWMESGLRIQIMGPPETFTGQEAIAAAEGL